MIFENLLDNGVLEHPDDIVYDQVRKLINKLFEFTLKSVAEKDLTNYIKSFLAWTVVIPELQVLGELRTRKLVEIHRDVTSDRIALDTSGIVRVSLSLKTANETETLGFPMIVDHELVFQKHETKEKWSERGIGIRYGRTIHTDFGSIVRSSIRRTDVNQTMKLNLERILVEFL